MKQSQLEWIPWNPDSVPAYTNGGKPSGSDRRIGLVAGIALFSALLQFFILRSLAHSGQVSKQAETSYVAVSSRPLLPSTVLTSDMIRYAALESKELAQNLVEQNAIRSFLGRAVTCPLPAGTPLIKGCLEGPSTPQSIQDKIPIGKRLVTVPAKWSPPEAQPSRGDRVDLLGLLRLPKEGNVTRILLNHALLVGFAKNLQGEGLFSFYVEPRDVVFLNHALRLGTFTVLLRNPNETEPLASDIALSDSQFFADPRVRADTPWDELTIRGESHESNP